MALTIRPGDLVIISARYASRQGIVLRAANYGNRFEDDPENWVIEIEDPYSHSDSSYGSNIWKQDVDGGTVEVVTFQESN